MPAPTEKTDADRGLNALGEISEAVASGAGLPEVVRAAARALDASIVLIDRSSSVLAVAAASPADERSLMADGEDVQTLELRVGDRVVGRLRLRTRGADPEPAFLSLVTTLVASELERVRAPELATAAAGRDFLHSVLAQEVSDRDDVIARGKELGIDLDRGACVVVAHVHPLAPTDDDWRARALTIAERGARASAPGSIAAPLPAPGGRGGEVIVLVADPDGTAGARVSEAVQREFEAGMVGFAFTLGRSRGTVDASELHRAGHEAVLAANVAEAGSEQPLLAFEETGAYRLLLRAMIEDPAELQRFYSETLEPLIAYDEQYETDLVNTLEAFLEADANVAATAQRLFTHRHTIRYRLERVRELSGLDVGSTDGREKLGLGLKAMRVLGIATPHGPAREHGASAGRVPREAKDRG